MRIDVEKLRAYLLDYYGTAAFGGFPFAIMDVCDIEDMDAFELCRKAEQMGVDLRKFEACDVWFQLRKTFGSDMWLRSRPSRTMN